MIMEYEYPTLVRRYLASLIDSVFIMVMIFAVSYLFQSEQKTIEKIRVAVILFMFFVYEPFCTSFFCTLGQIIMGIRIRRHISLERISLPLAYLRIIVKIILGLISFFTVPFAKERRAIHDFASDSIVVCKGNNVN